MTVLRGLTDQEYAELQAAAKLFKLPATLRIHRQQYASGAVDIRPTKQPNGLHRWTPEQFAQARAFAQAYGLTTTSGLDGEHAAYVYASGLHYLRKQVS